MSYPRAARAFDARAIALLAAALAITCFLFPSVASADIVYGSGSDQVTLNSASAIALDPDLVISGGLGNDALTLSNTAVTNPARLLHWESIRLTDGASLEFNSTLILGGSDALPVELTLERGSTLLMPYLSASIAASARQPLLVVNHGDIDMRGTTANQLLIDGDYTGSGRIFMDLVTGGDNSPSDRLIINGGRASGSTELVFNRLTGGGSDTQQGILVVEARNGGTTASDAFYLNGSVSAGPYEYFLFRGTDDPEQADNWYLRSTLLPGDTVPIALQSGSGTGPNSHNTTVAPGPSVGNAPIPLYRPEIPLYAQAKSLARLTSLQEIGSYHKRRGEQRSWFDGTSEDWMRIHHMSADYGWRGDVNNRFDGTISGFQLGTNLWSGPTCTGGAREGGVFFGSTRASGDVSGFVRGFNDYHAGENQLTSHHAGYYFDDYRPNMGYFDFTAKVAYVKLESRSSRGIGDTIAGPQLTLSMEKGITLQVAEQFNLEPQLQVIVNYSNLSAIDDGISWIEPDMTPEANFRAGLRAYNTDSRWLDHNLRLYLFGNVWHTLGGNDQLLFDQDLQLDLEREATWGEFGGGIVLLEHKLGNAFVNVGYQRSLDRLDWSSGSASLGFNWAW